jgi:hypothetical protein
MTGENFGKMKIDRSGCTRIVILTKQYAIKVPNVCDYRMFLNGLLANLTESLWRRWPCAECCPVLFALPFGLMVVMPRVRLMTDAEFLDFDYEGFTRKESYSIAVENKSNSFGWLDGKVVAIDYGN